MSNDYISTKKANQKVTDTIVELMETHGTDWVKPWADGTAILSRNAKTGRIYKDFFNQIILLV